MAKFDTDEIGKPGKPPKAARRFPWRLWLYAIVMTAAAVFGGKYAWQYRQQGLADGEAKTKCETDLGKTQGQEAIDKQNSDSCLSSLQQKVKQNTELQAQLTTVAGNLNASKDELDAVREQRAEAEKRVAAITELQKQFTRMIDTGQLKVAARRGSFVLSLPSEVLFPSGVADLSKQGELAVLEVGITLKRFPDRRFLVVGHTDDVPLKSSTYKDNWELSTARALTVTRFLISAGMDSKNVLAAGAADNDPVSKDRAKNRRIEIVLLPALSELPPLPASLGPDTQFKDGEPKPAAPAAPGAPAAAAPAAPATPAPAAPPAKP